MSNPKNKKTSALGDEPRKERAITTRSLVLATCVTLLLFGLLPLSEYVRGDEWIVREVDWIDVPKPPQKKPALEQRLEEKRRNAPKPPELMTPRRPLELESLETTMEVGPGDFRAVFALTDFDLAPSDVSGEFIFKLHELDRTPNILKRGRLRYPNALLRRNLEGKVKLLVLINEHGVVKVQQVVSSTHPDFVEPSVRAAEESIYEPPLRNGEPVKVQFYLPLDFKLSKE